MLRSFRHASSQEGKFTIPLELFQMHASVLHQALERVWAFPTHKSRCASLILEHRMAMQKDQESSNGLDDDTCFMLLLPSDACSNWRRTEVKVLDSAGLKSPPLSSQPARRENLTDFPSSKIPKTSVLSSTESTQLIILSLLHRSKREPTRILSSSRMDKLSPYY